MTHPGRLFSKVGLSHAPRVSVLGVAESVCAESSWLGYKCSVHSCAAGPVTKLVSLMLGRLGIPRCLMALGAWKVHGGKLLTGQSQEGHALAQFSRICCWDHKDL